MWDNPSSDTNSASFVKGFVFTNRDGDQETPVWRDGHLPPPYGDLVLVDVDHLCLNDELVNVLHQLKLKNCAFTKFYCDSPEGALVSWN